MIVKHLAQDIVIPKGTPMVDDTTFEHTIVIKSEGKPDLQVHFIMDVEQAKAAGVVAEQEF